MTPTEIKITTKATMEDFKKIVKEIEEIKKEHNCNCALDVELIRPF